MESYFGRTIEVKGRRFILTNLELYFGGIGDKSHDWYRARFPEKYDKHPRVSTELSNLILLEGPRIYQNKKSISNRTRCDIIVGPQDVAISFLIRNMLDENGNLVIPKENGGTMKIAELFNLSPNEIGSQVMISTTPDEKYKGIHPSKKKRSIGGKYIGFVEFNDEKEWNYNISEHFL